VGRCIPCDIRSASGDTPSQQLPKGHAVYMADSHQVQMASIWHSLSCRWGVCCPVYIVECQRTFPQQGKGGEVWARWHLPHTLSNSHGTSEYQGIFEAEIRNGIINGVSQKTACHNRSARMPEKPYRLFPGHSFCTSASYLRDVHFASTLICTLHDTNFLLHSILAALESFFSLLLFASWAFMHRSLQVPSTIPLCY